MKIAITGNIGAGKSTLIKSINSKYNIPIFNMDSIIHDIIKSEKIQQYLIKKFNTNDRLEISKIAFNSTSPFPLLYLESQTYEPLYQKIEQIFLENDTVFMEVPLLYEKGFQILFDKIILVSCNEEDRIKRVLQRDNKSIEHIQNIVKKQMKESIKQQLADFTFINENHYQNNEELFSFLSKIL